MVRHELENTEWARQNNYDAVKGLPKNSQSLTKSQHAASGAKYGGLTGLDETVDLQAVEVCAFPFLCACLRRKLSCT